MAAEPYRFDGEFVIDSVLGEGGMGKVFRARQVALDRWVALKVLSRAQDKTFIDRFYREARSAARLVHPNIIQIHTVGELQGIPYFAMEYIEGADLQNILTDAATTPDGALTIDEIGEIIRSVVKALAVAMEHGIVHRDIKPANIMVTRSGLVKVMDFGLAKNRSSDLGLTQSGLVVGTPSYMSPEQGASKPVDTRSDLYSLGCVMYECITGRIPFVSDNVASLIYKHMYENPEAPSALGKSVPPDLEEICLKMLKKDPAERYQNPAEVLEQFSKVALNSGVAELSLSKRATRIAEARQKSAAQVKVNLTSADFLGASMPAFAPASQNPPQPALVIPPAPAHIPAPPRSPVNAREPVVLNPESMPAASTKVAEEVHSTPVPTFRADSATLGTVRTSTRVFSHDSETRKTISKIHATFLKTPDGLWSYKPELPHCNFSEGLAALLPALPAPPDEKTGGLGDCLLCSNWSKRHGCVLGFSQELEAKNRLKGIKLIAEQAIAWCGAGRFEKAIALLDHYIKSNPEDPEGFRELAFIYERPDYKGKDKRRSIVLYKRFIELARNSNLVSNVELSRIEDRVTALSNSNPPPQKLPLSPNAGFTFQCFYRGPAAATTYVQGCAVQEQIVVARAGDVEPDSGITSAQMGGALGLASTIFRRLKSDQARKDEQQLVKNELTRLGEMMPEELQRESGFVLNVPLSQIVSVTMSVDQAVGTRCVTFKNDQRVSHQFIFTEGNAFKAEQCHELLRRKAKSPLKN